MSSSPAADTDRTRTAALWASTLASFITPFLGSSLNIALPAITRDFGFTAVEVTWIPTAYLLANVLFMVPFGRLADIRGRKRIFIVGIWIDVAACLLATLTPSGTLFIALRAFQGLGGAMIFSTGIAILTSVYPPEQRGRVLGINVASVYAGLSLGPVIGGFLTHNFGWHSIFIANILIGSVIIFIVATKLKGEWAQAKGEQFDWQGALLYGVAFVVIMSGFSAGNMLHRILSFGGGMALMVLFALRELRTTHPVLELRLFRNPAFTFSNLAALFNYSATYAVAFMLSLYLQEIRSLDAQQAGLVMLSQPVIMALLSPLAGRLSDRIQPRIVASIGMGLTTAGLLVFTILGSSTPLPIILSGLVILGFGFAFFSSPNTNGIMGAVDRKFLGTAAGLVGTMRLSGQLLSMGITTIVFTHFLGGRTITEENGPQFLQAFHTVFMVATALCCVGIFTSLARGSISRDPLDTSSSHASS